MENDDILMDEIILEADDDTDESDFQSLLDLSGPIQLSVDELVPDGKKYVVFHLDDTQYAVNSKDVSEVAPALPLTALPNVPLWFLGIANLRGEMISVIDLRRLWQKNTKTPHKYRLIVFHSPRHETSFAFVVDKLNEMVTLSDTDIDLSQSDFVSYGKAEFKSQPLHLLDAHKILSSLNLADARTV